jgi:hypothetical protein
MDYPSSCLTLAPFALDIRPTLPCAKTIFDGTKLPLVVAPPQNHIPWYEITFLPLFDDQESRHFATLANENSVDRSRPIEFIRDGLI